MITLIVTKISSYQELQQRHFYIKKLPLVLIILIHLTFYYLVFPNIVIGNTVTNNNYSIDVGTINTNPQPTSPPQKNQVLGISTYTPNYFTTGPNYKVTTSESSLLFESSQSLIDYGILTSTNPEIRTSDLTLSSSQVGGQILSDEDHPLSTSTNDVIQNTTCDNGSCSPFIAAIWTNTLTYGFGYRCDSELNEVCDTQFSSINYFKQYSDDPENQNLVPIVTNMGGINPIQATITYKVNISGTQKTGGYSNTLTYIAIPNF